MALTLNPDGTIKADTPAELAQFMEAREQQRALTAATEQQPVASARQLPKAEQVRPAIVPPQKVDRDSAYRFFYEHLSEHPQQQHFLRTLLSSSRHMTDAELRTALHLSTNIELRGLIIGVIRRAKNRGLPVPFVKQMTRTDGGRRRLYKYAATPAFRRAIEGVRVEGGLLESA
jgi:hypothetical protein